MQHTIYIRDELVLEAHLDADAPHILLGGAGEPGVAESHLKEMGYLPAVSL